MNFKNEAYWPSEQKLKAALSDALIRVDRNMEKFKDCFPYRCAEELFYKKEDNVSWTSGFWPGILWLSYELTGDKKYADCAEGYIDSFYSRIVNKKYVNHHDMGFLYSLSCMPAYMLFGNEKAKNALVLSADHLCLRFREKGGFLNAWSNIENIKPENNFYIIDCLMNIPLLYRVSEITGESRYSKIADSHLKTTMKTIIREDNSTHHSYLFDLETGKPIGGLTQQGFSDESTWSRGQAWGVLGFALNYSDTHYKEDIDCFRRVTDFFVKHLPSDFVPYWDLIFMQGDEARDSSAAAIAVCGILEMEKYIDEDWMSDFSEFGGKMLNSLIDNYAPPSDMKTDGLLLRSTGAATIGMGVDQPSIFGDYFYFEAITRLLKKDWKMYW